MSGDYKRLMAEARTKVGDMDDRDGRTIASEPPSDALRTVIQAIKTAMNMQEWSIVAEAQVMLQQIEVRLRPPGKYGGGRIFLDERTT